MAVVASTRAFLDRLGAMVATARSAHAAGDGATARLWLAATEDELDWVLDVLAPHATDHTWKVRFYDHVIAAFVQLVAGLSELESEIDGSPD